MRIRIHPPLRPGTDLYEKFHRIVETRNKVPTVYLVYNSKTDTVSYEVVVDEYSESPVVGRSPNTFYTVHL